MLGWDQSEIPDLRRHLRCTPRGRPRPARQIAIRNALTGVITLPAAPAGDSDGQPGDLHAGAGDAEIEDADLRDPLGDVPVSARAGQRCPQHIGAIELSVAETARLTALARQYTAGLIGRARLAFAKRRSKVRILLGALLGAPISGVAAALSPA